MEEYLPIPFRLFIRRAPDADDIQRCMTAGILLGPCGLPDPKPYNPERPRECDERAEIWQGSVILMPDTKVDVSEFHFGYRLDQVVTASWFTDPHEGK